MLWTAVENLEWEGKTKKAISLKKMATLVLNMMQRAYIKTQSNGEFSIQKNSLKFIKIKNFLKKSIICV